MNNTQHDTLAENMTDNAPANVDVTPAPAPATNRTEAAKKTSLALRRKLVVIGAVLTLLGWLTLMLNEWLALSLTAAGLVVSILGVRIPPGPRRDVAVTSIIAASVLLLVIIGIEIAIGIIS